MGTPTVAHRPDQHRFELQVDGEPAGVLDYRFARDGAASDREPDASAVVEMFHTKVFPAFEGHGYGGVLARAALNHARAHQWRIIPTCWYVAKYLNLHAADQDLLASSVSRHDGPPER